MSSEFDIIIPRLCVKHILPLQMLSASSKISNIITSLSLLTGIKKEILYRCIYKDILIAVENILSVADRCIKNEKLKNVVEINGNKYYLLDPSRITVGWAIDYSLIDTNNPAHIAALIYIDDGKDYSDGDLMKRAEIMNELPLEDYVAATSFFLKYLKAKNILRRILLGKRE